MHKIILKQREELNPACKGKQSLGFDDI